MVYTTNTAVKTYQKITGSGDDDLIDDLIDRAQKAIETYCGRAFEAATETRYFDVPSGEGEVWIDGVVRSGVNARTLWLDKDLLTVTTLTNGNDEEIEDTEYDLIPKNYTPKYAIRLKQSTTVAWQGSDDGDTEDVIQVTGTWGYSTEPPDDIVHACIRLASYYYRQREAQVFDTTAIPEAGVITIPQGIPADVKLILDPYVRHI